MTTTTDATSRSARPTITAAALAIAGLAFAFYPMLRGSGSESGAAGAELYARDAWVVAHALGMLGFVLASWALGILDRLTGHLAMAGTLLVLPYYGAETFGLHAIGQQALDTGEMSGVAAADLFRYQPLAVTMFAIGLLLLAAAGVRLLVLARGNRAMMRPAQLLVGAGLATYLPQFFLPIEGRIVHGLVLGVGLVLLAAALLARDDAIG